MTPHTLGPADSVRWPAIRVSFEAKVISISAILGLLVWIVDAVLDTSHFYPGHTFTGLLLLAIPAHEIYIRTVILGVFILFGVLMAKALAKQKSTEDELKTAYDDLERRVAERTDALKRRTERLKNLQAIARATLERRRPDAIAWEALTGIRDLLPLERASVCMFDFLANESQLMAVLSPGSTALKGGCSFSLTPYERILDTLRQGEFYLLKDTSAVSCQWPLIEEMAQKGIRSLMLLPLCSESGLIGALCVSSTRSDAFQPEHIEVAQEVSNLLAVVFQNARLFDSVDEQCIQLRSLNTRLADVEEAERRRLARELHDRVGQNLSALAINIRIVAGLLPPETVTAAGPRLEDSSVLVDETMSCIRDVMADLRPAPLDDYGLSAALSLLSEQFSMRTGVESVLDVDRFSKRLSPASEIALYRIAQEALTNVTRHAKASEVYLTLEEEGSVTRMAIADDGVGFAPQSFRFPANQQSWGLISMRERAEALGGRLSVDSAPGMGTRIVVELKGGTI